MNRNFIWKKLRVSKRAYFLDDRLRRIVSENILAVGDVVQVESDIHRNGWSFPEFVHNSTRCEPQLLSRTVGNTNNFI